MAEVQTSKNESENRYEAWVDGELAGAAYYELDEKRIVFTHTEVEDRFEGHGVGSALARVRPGRRTRRGHPPGGAAVPVHQGLDRQAPRLPGPRLR